MGAWNMTDAASKKDIERSQKAAFEELQEAIANILTQQKKLGESLSRKMNEIQATQKQMTKDIADINKSVAAVEEFICFAMANNLLDNLEQMAVHVQDHKKKRKRV